VSGNSCDAFRGGDVPGQQLHRRAFAGTVGAQKGHQFPFMHLKGHIAARRKGAIKFGEANGLDHRLAVHFVYHGIAKSQSGGRKTVGYSARMAGRFNILLRNRPVFGSIWQAPVVEWHKVATFGPNAMAANATATNRGKKTGLST
jgi:hypothetical protein